MKLDSAKFTARAAFTLTETLVTMSLALVVIAGTLTGHLAGARMFQFTATKLGGNDDSRSAIAKLTQDIRSAKLVEVGIGDAGGFTNCGSFSLQQGNAIQVYPTTATNSYIRYFRGGDDRLRRLVSGEASTVVLANFITNAVVFTAENFNGDVCTNSENNRVIGLTMQFYQIQYPVVMIGADQLYDFYQVRTKVTRRTLE